MTTDPSDLAAPWLNGDELKALMAKNAKEDPVKIREIFAKAKEMKGLTLEDVAALSAVEDKDLVEEMFAVARHIKEEIYGRRVVFFAPLYVSNLCSNECAYCAFRKSNHQLVRQSLTQEQVAQQTEMILNQGHKRGLIIAGEAYPGGLKYILDCIETMYSVKTDKGELRRINAELAPMTVDEFKSLKATNIGTYVCFQETYDRDVYKQVHLKGKKADFEWRASTFDRAMLGGIDDVGLGVLFGLADWKYEVLGLMRHIQHLEERFGVGCHTISFPRIEPACGSEMSKNPPHAVSDLDFLKIIAIMRLAVPYTGMIMSTRETPEMRKKTLDLGISQISAGSRTDPGGYTEDDGKFEQDDAAQFHLGDHRTLAQVIDSLVKDGMVPSFCTACYRLGRTGQDFMDLAKPGLIKQNCAPNAISTFCEYLMDYASPETIERGLAAIDKEIATLNPEGQKIAREVVKRVRAGERDVFC
ncbi:MAG: [FeFe] hydrogenase H-cluster radical SAM maturase HydG [Alphaproteobacteria bacterium]|nr:[FeFe] hydrogenase H-cluster radical SAM maturase HydG [Alphaproteobacteria bacterium]